MFKTIFKKDLANKKMLIAREFEGTVEEVWQAWTTSEILDQWWAPKPWKANTKSMDFREGGYWLYYMQSPEGERHYAKINYKKITAPTVFEAIDSFCDENGVENNSIPHMHWRTSFKPSANGNTLVEINITYASLKDLETIVEMGFEAGFTAAHENLDQYLRAKFKLRSELKKDNVTRVTTYLNFPGNTEEAFTFYKKVFRSEFSGKGIQRFGDIPADAGHPPVADNIKKMILHVELPILEGQHILMATDAPQEMGFTLTTGNNMHICLEPATRTETKRLFDELSEKGNVTMPLMDMFFGAYYGSCTDQYGINWMVNCTEKK
ncbi:MAG TPA: SRPBCC domain-containing protein [Ohtaekwangia sp.]|uniref:SRPBCC domain-containing protein n=1 Tax=Ohtaekwangia sp. TaxID=2066019 RepID=UPI002F9541E2